MNRKLKDDALLEPTVNDLKDELGCDDLHYHLLRNRADLQNLIEDEKELLPALGLEYVEAIEQYHQLEFQERQLWELRRCLREMYNSAVTISDWYYENYQSSLEEHPQQTGRVMHAAVRYQLKAYNRANRTTKDLWQKALSLKTQYHDLKVEIKMTANNMSDLSNLIADDHHKTRIINLLQKLANLNRQIASESLSD